MGGRRKSAKLARHVGFRRVARWFRTYPLRAMITVSLLSVVLALAMGAPATSNVVQDVAGDFVGGVVAALVVFAVADGACGFTERRRGSGSHLRQPWA
jgi:hypothetical protein